MKNVALLALSFLLLVACHRKTVPAKNVNIVTRPDTAATAITKPIDTAAVTIDTVTAITETPAPPPAAMIVIDGYGKIRTPQTKLPDQNIKPDYAKIARAFTPQQLANLKQRYNMIPPKVLYVPDQYTIKSLRGTYCVYKKKFWYWKKEDGLFYLDETYYL